MYERLCFRAGGFFGGDDQFIEVGLLVVERRNDLGQQVLPESTTRAAGKIRVQSHRGRFWAAGNRQPEAPFS